MKLAQLVIVLTIAVGAAVGGTYAEPAGALSVNRPVEELSFSPADPAQPDGLQVSPLWGDMQTSANGFMVKLPAGYASPLHIHSADYRGMVIEGVVVNPQEGEEPPVKLPAGSFWFQPADAKHLTACVSGTDCLVYVAFDGPYDAK